ncbi:MAG: hypothetical protein IKR78_02075 [Dehalococcoidales bacterium]|nr:hypothetical protein [Dehalococcoidales bacterium]
MEDNKDKVMKNNLSDDNLEKVSGGMLWFGEDAPDGHEIGCLVAWYEDWDEYYFDNNICKYCKGELNPKVYHLNGTIEYKKCTKCGMSCE